MGQNSTDQLTCAYCPISLPRHQIAGRTKSPETYLAGPTSGDVWSVIMWMPGGIIVTTHLNLKVDLFGRTFLFIFSTIDSHLDAVGFIDERRA